MPSPCRGAGEAKIIAGGQTLVPLLAMRLARPALLIDINRIAALQGIADERRRGRHPRLHAPGRARSAHRDGARARCRSWRRRSCFVGHGQTRNRGTIGGSLANADPGGRDRAGRAGARCRDRRRARPGASGRSRSANSFVGADGDRARARRMPDRRCAFRSGATDGRIGTGFQEMSIRHSDFALVAAAAAQLALDEGGVCRRIAISLGGAGATPAPHRRGREARWSARGSSERDIADGRRTRARRRSTPLADLHASAALSPPRRRRAGRARHRRGARRGDGASLTCRSTTSRCTVNGSAAQRRRRRRALTLVDFLRDELRLTGHACRLRARRVRRVLGAAGRRAGALLPALRGPGRRRRRSSLSRAWRPTPRA